VNDVIAHGVAVVPDDPVESEEAFAAADVYLDLSLSPEFGLGSNRALAYGLPVIASNLPANRLLPIMLSDDPDSILKAVASRVADVFLRVKRQPFLFPMADSFDLSARIENFAPY
jgi:hypothetical protein